MNVITQGYGDGFTVVAASASINSPIKADLSAQIVAGYDYAAADDQGLGWSVPSSQLPDLSTATITLYIMKAADFYAGTGVAALTLTGSVTTVSSNQVFIAELTAAQTATLSTSPPDDPMNYIYQLTATISGREFVIKTNALTCLRSAKA